MLALEPTRSAAIRALLLNKPSKKPKINNGSHFIWSHFEVTDYIYQAILHGIRVKFFVKSKM